MTAMSATEAPDLLDEVLDLASPLTGPADFDPLLERTRDARVVMIGEASHGTSEFYSWRRLPHGPLTAGDDRQLHLPADVARSGQG